MIIFELDYKKIKILKNNPPHIAPTRLKIISDEILHFKIGVECLVKMLFTNRI